MAFLSNVHSSYRLTLCKLRLNTEGEWFFDPTEGRYDARFVTRVSHPARLKLLHACDQCHSPRAFTTLTDATIHSFRHHYNLRPNTEGMAPYTSSRRRYQHPPIGRRKEMIQRVTWKVLSVRVAVGVRATDRSRPGTVRFPL
jgi:hypothetical protein